MEQLDDLYAKASSIVIKTKNPSIAHLQRKLGIGYNRASRLINGMETEGLVSSYVEGQPRKVLVL